MFIVPLALDTCAPAERDVFHSIELHVAPDGAASLGLYLAINILLLRSKEFCALSALFGQSQPKNWLTERQHTRADFQPQQDLESRFRPPSGCERSVGTVIVARPSIPNARYLTAGLPAWYI